MLFRSRAKVLTLFDAIPVGAKAKTKRPFERRMTPDVHNRIKPKIRRRLVNDLAVLETDLQLMEITPPENITTQPEIDTAIAAQRERVAHAKRALAVLDAMPDTEALPITWHALAVP